MEFGYWEENYKLWPGLAENRITTEEEANRYFNFDRIEIIRGETWLLPPFEERVIEETGDKKVIINEDGLYAELPKDGHSTIPHFLKSSVTNPEQWKRVKEERFSLEHPGRQPDIGALKKQHPENRDYPLGVFCGSMIGKIRDLLSLEGLAYGIYDYPEMVEDIIETSCRLVEYSLDRLLPHFNFDFASGWEDICYKNGPLVSLDFFNSVVVPRYRRIRKKLDQFGIHIWYTDCDGDIRPIIDGFLDGGINCMFPFEVMGSGHPGALLEKYDGRLTILGGFDKTKLIAGKKAIKSYMESLIPPVEKGGFIPFCDHRCPPDVTWENYLYYLDLKESIFGMK
jgi:uroporphyrinogen decarboxylase